MSRVVYGYVFHHELFCELMDAARYGHLEEVQQIICSGVSLSSKNLALSAAAYNGHIHIVQYLLERGADVHEPWALRWSVFFSRWDSVACLFHYGADYTKLSPILLEEFYNSEKALQYFSCQIELSLQKRNISELNELLCVATRIGYVPALQLFVAAGVDIFGLNNLALRQTVREGHLSVVQFFISNGALPIVLNDALQWAIFYEQWHIVACLLRQGLDTTKLTVAELEKLRNDSRAQKYIASELHEAFQALDFSTANKLLEIIPAEKLPSSLQEEIWDF